MLIKTSQELIVATSRKEVFENNNIPGIRLTRTSKEGNNFIEDLEGLESYSDKNLYEGLEDLVPKSPDERISEELYVDKHTPLTSTNFSSAKTLYRNKSFYLIDEVICYVSVDVINKVGYLSFNEGSFENIEIEINEEELKDLFISPLQFVSKKMDLLAKGAKIHHQTILNINWRDNLLYTDTPPSKNLDELIDVISIESAFGIITLKLNSISFNEEVKPEEVKYFISITEEKAKLSFNKIISNLLNSSNK